MKISSLSDLVTIRRGQQMREADRRAGEYPVVTAGREQRGTHETANFQGPSVTLSSHGAVGQVLYWPGPIWLANNVFLLEPKTDQLMPRYLYYVLKSRESDLRALAQVGGIRYVNARDVLGVRVALPPLEDQKRIVGVLDHFTKLEAELEAELETERVARQRQFEHHRRSLLAPRGAGRQSRLRDVVDFFNAKAHERLVHPDGTVALMTARFISRGEANRFVRPEDVLTPALLGDVAMVMSDLPNGRALAKTFLVDEDGKYAANQRVCLLRTRDPSTLNSRYLAHALNRNEQLLAYDTGVDQTHLKKDHILDVEVELPTLEEQLRIVDILDELAALVYELSIGLSAELAARRKQYEYYRDKLLTFEEASA